MQINTRFKAELVNENQLGQKGLFIKYINIFTFILFPVVYYDNV